jgi:hypothetical protein
MDHDRELVFERQQTDSRQYLDSAIRRWPCCEAIKNTCPRSRWKDRLIVPGINNSSYGQLLIKINQLPLELMENLLYMRT